MNLKKFPSLQFVIMDQISLLSPLSSNDRSIPLNLNLTNFIRRRKKNQEIVCKIFYVSRKCTKSEHSGLPRKTAWVSQKNDLTRRDLGDKDVLIQAFHLFR
jgi:hypothetical protein